MTSVSTAKSAAPRSGTLSRGRRYEVMLANERSLKRCVRLLIAKGRRYGGYVSYRIVRDALHGIQPEVSMEALDLIYERLVAEGIEIVDQIPDRPAIAAGSDTNEAEEGSGSEYQPLARVARRKRRYKYGYDTSEASTRRKPRFCPERAIDMLLFRAEAGLPCGRIFLKIISSCKLSRSEVGELVEYLWSQGIDIPDLDLSQFYDGFHLDDDGAVAEEEHNVLSDTVEEYPPKKSNDWEDQ